MPQKAYDPDEELDPSKIESLKDDFPLGAACDPNKLEECEVCQ